MLKRLLVSIFVSFLIGVLAACSIGNTDASHNIPTSENSSGNGKPFTSSPTAVSSTTDGSVPLQITNVYVNINPTTLIHVSCGSTTDIIFTATIYSNVGNSGGQVTYTWVINGVNIPGIVTFSANDISKTVVYTMSGVLIQYNAVNIPVIFTVNSPNQVTSSPVKVAGNCTFPNAFVVTSISIVVNPTSINGIACNTRVMFTYTATVTIGANSNGGTAFVVWQHTGFTRVSRAVFGPGTTTQTMTYPITARITKISPLPSVSMSSTTPNVITSNTAVSVGTCV